LGNREGGPARIRRKGSSLPKNASFQANAKKKREDENLHQSSPNLIQEKKGQEAQLESKEAGRKAKRRTEGQKIDGEAEEALDLDQKQRRTVRGAHRWG